MQFMPRIKQVDVAEYNPMEAIKTNILGSQNFMEACQNEVTKVIALSTDKALIQLVCMKIKLCSDKLFIAGNNIQERLKQGLMLLDMGIYLNLGVSRNNF